jgi:uncharacterized cupin superfamily protein
MSGSSSNTPALIRYSPGDDVGPLEEWPFTNPASNYVIHEGAPIASGRMDAGGSGETTRCGIWKCTRGKFECTEMGDELMTILEGNVRVIDTSDNSVVELGPGDTMFSRDGKRVIWDVIEDVIKVFYGFKAEGF